MNLQAGLEQRAYRDLRRFVEALAATAGKTDDLIGVVGRFPDLRDRLVVVRAKKKPKNFRIVHYGRDIARQNGFEMGGLRFGKIRKMLKGTSAWRAGKRSLQNYVNVSRSGVPVLARNEFKIDDVGFGRFHRLTIPVFVNGKLRYIASAVLYEN
jgi:hypothetical protein